MSSEVAEILETVAKGAGEVAKFSPPPVNIVASIISVALKAGAAIAHAGQDPIIEITRILDRNPAVTKVRGEWEDFIRDNWRAYSTRPPVGRRKTDPPPPSESAPTSPERREIDPSMPAVTEEDIYEPEGEDPHEG